MKKEKVEGIVLSPEEAAAIEAQRNEIKLLEDFKVGYAKLVKETGFTWAVDGSSPLNNIQLGIGKAPK